MRTRKSRDWFDRGRGQGKRAARSASRVRLDDCFRCVRARGAASARRSASSKASPDSLARCLRRALVQHGSGRASAPGARLSQRALVVAKFRVSSVARSAFALRPRAESLHRGAAPRRRGDASATSPTDAKVCSGNSSAAQATTIARRSAGGPRLARAKSIRNLRRQRRRHLRQKRWPGRRLIARASQTPPIRRRASPTADPRGAKCSSGASACNARKNNKQESLHCPGCVEPCPAESFARRPSKNLRPRALARRPAR